MVCSALGYENDTMFINVDNGVMTTQDIVLCPPCSTLNLATSLTYSICLGDTIFIGGSAYSSSGSYVDTLLTSYGCDSIVNTDVLILDTTSNTSNVTACDTYTWFVNGNIYTITSSGTYTDVSTNVYGCDHTEILNLTINISTSNTSALTACDSYIWPVDGQFYNISGTYIDSSINSAGCIHTEILYLTIDNSTSNSTTAAACDSYTWSVDGQNYMSTGIYTDTSISLSGCIHVETLDLTIYSSFNFSQNFSLCEGDSVFVGSNTYYNSGIYTNIFQTVNGCDSAVITDLIVYPIDLDAEILSNNNELEINLLNGSASAYLWSTGEVSSSIVPTSFGVYWCLVSDLNGCFSDTAFYNYTITSLSDLESYFRIFPNPIIDVVNIAFLNVASTILSVQNILGESVYSTVITKKGRIKKQLDFSNYSNGVYFIELTNEYGVLNKKVIKN